MVRLFSVVLVGLFSVVLVVLFSVVLVVLLSVVLGRVGSSAAMLFFELLGEVGGWLGVVVVGGASGCRPRGCYVC